MAGVGIVGSGVEFRDAGMDIAVHARYIAHVAHMAVGRHIDVLRRGWRAVVTR
jgi:hypothetical protein